MNICPHCKRTLLSHASMRCNWCGEEIADNSYQQKAAEERAAFRAHEAQRDALEAARGTSMAYSPLTGWGGPLTAARILSNSWQRRRQMEAEVKAQQRAMEEYAATGQGGANLPAQSQPTSQGWQGIPVAQNQNLREEGAPKPEDEVKSMFRHLEL